jgi:poly(hydroxyalkanoate) depolymerase family esterase
LNYRTITKRNTRPLLAPFAIALLACSACVTSKSTETIVSGTMVRVVSKTTHGTFATSDGSRDFTAYRPATFPTKPEERALVVMLHGCSQSADDLARSTRMNTVADSGAFLVLYPEQAVSADAQQCWRWYLPQQTTRGQGEVAILAGMIDSVAKSDGIAAKHISIVGMSVGAAMAANLVVAYPERYGALAMYAGAAALSATDRETALAVLKSGPANADALGARAIAAMGAHLKAIPLVLLHGDADTLVSPANMRAAAMQFSAINAAAPSGTAPVEEHLLPGIGHAWSGGAAESKSSAPDGPNATLIIATFLRKVGAIF